MDTPILLTIIGIVILIVLFAVIAINRNKGEKIEPDYRVFFILGITWLPIGIATDNLGLLEMGAIFMVVGLINRSKWKEEPKWSELDPEKRRTKILVILGLTTLLAAGLVFYLLVKSN